MCGALRLRCPGAKARLEDLCEALAAAQEIIERADGREGENLFLHHVALVTDSTADRRIGE